MIIATLAVGVLCCCSCLVFTVSLVRAETEFYLTDEAYDLLPPIFHIDDYEKCKQESNHFCKVTLELTSLHGTNSSQIWKDINQTKSDPRMYRHDELFHAICVEEFCKHHIDQSHLATDLNYTIEECYNRKYREFGLAVKLMHADCNNYDDSYPVTRIDIVVLTVFLSYILFVIYATYHHYHHKVSQNDYIPRSFIGRYRRYFSLIHNWKRLRTPNTNPEFQRLKSMQAFRSYTMFAIIMCHTYCSFIGGYIANTKYFEDFALYPHKHFVRNSFVFLVQAFFLFSAWLLSYHMFQIIDNVDPPRIKYIWLTFFNRYLRILPNVVPAVALSGTLWVMCFFYGPVKDLYADRDYQRCRENWWTNLIFINNHYNHDEMCYFITWYLAADTQLYALSLIILYLIWKYKRRTKLILSVSIVVGILSQSLVTYIYDTDILYRITPENAKNHNYRSFWFNATYTATYSNMATYMLGLTFGYIYYKYKDHKFFKSKSFKILWWLAFPGLPTSVLIVCCYKYNRLVTCILSGILKPLYALGIGIGIMGMAHNIGGIVKSVIEWKWAIFFGSCAYSTYLAHYGIVFARTAIVKTPVYVSDYILISAFLQDVLISFPSGLIFHMLVEMPMIQLQNAIIPQVRTIRRQQNLKTKEICKTKGG